MNYVLVVGFIVYMSVHVHVWKQEYTFAKALCACVRVCVQASVHRMIDLVICECMHAMHTLYTLCKLQRYFRPFLAITSSSLVSVKFH